jgi:hypothetical protein
MRLPRAASLVLASLPSCGSFGAEKTAPVPDAATPVVTDAGSPSDADVDAGARFCTQHPGVLMCDDFDDPAGIRSRWQIDDEGGRNSVGLLDVPDARRSPTS